MTVEEKSSSNLRFFAQIVLSESEICRRGFYAENSINLLAKKHVYFEMKIDNFEHYQTRIWRM